MGLLEKEFLGIVILFFGWGSCYQDLPLNAGKTRDFFSLPGFSKKEIISFKFYGFSLEIIRFYIYFRVTQSILFQ